MTISEKSQEIRGIDEPVTCQQGEKMKEKELQQAAVELYRHARKKFHQKVDKIFLVLLCIQWPAAILLAVYMTPTTWAGADSSLHFHVYMAVFLGGLITIFPAFLIWKHSGAVITRHVAAAAAMIFTAMFIHLSGGRDEAHFHVFIMLAFAALYFDWRVLLTAIIVGALDHILGAFMFPMSVFGVLESPWIRLVRHILWVVFESSVLVYAAVLIDKEKRAAAFQVAISQSREAEINELLKTNQQESSERQRLDQEAKQLAEDNRLAEVKLREAAEIMSQRVQETSDSQLLQVDSLLFNVNEAVSGNLNTLIKVRGDDPIGQVGQGLERLLNSLNASFREIGESTNTLTKSANELSLTSRELGQDATETSEQVERVASSADAINGGVQASASSTEQLNLAIREVSRCASEAVSVGEEAVSLTEQATTTVKKLGDSSSGIGNVLKVINSIAEQTNLLALNATIEAARAGDAGKGFAVVANEVKELAKETARATDEISSRISAIQSDAGNAGEVLAQIVNVIEQIDSFQTTVAAAVDEQTSTTREISNGLSKSARDSAEISQHITDIATRTECTKASALQVESSVKSLHVIAQQVQTLLDFYTSDHPVEQV